MRFAPWLALTFLSFAAAAAAQEQPAILGDRPSMPANALTTESLCLLFESATTANGLPLDFFVRLIWKESRFKPDAIGPVTRSGEQASGIAQFMPGTAAARGLVDPRDPIAALPKAAELLRDLRAEFGNLGLAAAAYDAGPRRVHDWLAGTGGLPAETRDYVAAITGRSAEDWKGVKDIAPPPPPNGCVSLVVQLRHSPSRFVAALEEHVAAGASRPWGAELAAGFSRERVLATYAAIETRERAALVGADAIIVHGRFRSRGTRDFYQVRIGADTRREAEDVCRRLERAGAACLVLRNAHGSAEAIGTKK
jgi:Transglycosylase SLT domain/SPOR domain